MDGNARFTGPKGSTLAVPVTDTPSTAAVPTSGPSTVSPTKGGKLMSNVSKSDANAVSWLKALVVPLCTITGKPNEVATRFADTGIVTMAIASKSNSPFITLLIN